MRSGDTLLPSWTSWAQIMSLKSKALLSTRGCLQHGARCSPQLLPRQAASPEVAWRHLCPKHRSRGQNHGHSKAHLSPRTTHPEITAT